MAKYTASELKPRIVSIINQHLTGWTFRWSNSRRTYGTCFHHGKTISISKPLAELNVWEQTQDTVLHEIAHALAGASHGHDKKWKQICVEIGAKPERCYSTSEVIQPVPKYYAICPSCGKVHVRNNFPRRRKYSCGYCTSVYNPDYLLEWKQNPMAE